ncbi:MAG: AI-2E family transporter [Acidobacteriaceae bacterium]
MLFTFAIALGLALAWRLRSVLELVYVSALFAVVMMPLVQNIMRLRIGRWSPSRPLAIVALGLSVSLTISLLLVFALPPVLRDIKLFGADLPRRIPLVVNRIKSLPLAERLGFDSIAARGESAAASTAQYLLASAPLWLSRVFDLFTAIILCVYFMLEGEFLYSYLLSFLPSGSRERLAKTLLIAEARMSRWFIGQITLMLTLGITSIIAFAALHVRYFFLLGVLMGLFNIVPVAGGIITIVLAAAVAATDSWAKMAGVLIFYLLYVQFENAFLTPRIMRSRVHLMGLSVLIALLAGTALAGVVGAMVAVPTAALLAVILDEYIVQKDSAPSDPLTANSPSTSTAVTPPQNPPHTPTQP